MLKMEMKYLDANKLDPLDWIDAHFL